MGFASERLVALEQEQRSLVARANHLLAEVIAHAQFGDTFAGLCEAEIDQASSALARLAQLKTQARELAREYKTLSAQL